MQKNDKTKKHVTPTFSRIYLVWGGTENERWIWSLTKRRNVKAKTMYFHFNIYFLFFPENAKDSRNTCIEKFYDLFFLLLRKIIHVDPPPPTLNNIVRHSKVSDCNLWEMSQSMRLLCGHMKDTVQVVLMSEGERGFGWPYLSSLPFIIIIPSSTQRHGHLAESCRPS